ncbi:MAG: PhnD/SsuA/transferrin family substrate-binding protein [Actinomycetota bacterium]|nr:PhnD/SsuA/transferrin family substrate-binding protein [Actinomycetota bacterium]
MSGITARRRAGAAFAALALAGVVAGCGGDDDDAASSETIRLAVTDVQGLEELQREFGAFKDTFEELTDTELEFFAVADRAAAATALDADRVDVVFTGPAEYVVMRARTDAEPIVAIRRPDYHSCIYTTVDSGITTVDELAGTTIAMSDVGSTSGHLGPSQLLVDAGFDPQEDMEILTVGDAVHEALVRGDVDAVGIGCHDYAEFMESDDPANYTMLVEGDPLPPDVLIARDGFDEDTVELVRTTFVDHFGELLESMLEGADNAKYENAEIVEVDDSDYDVVRSMYEAVGVDDFTEFVGD